MGGKSKEVQERNREKRFNREANHGRSGVIPVESTKLPVKPTKSIQPHSIIYAKELEVEKPRLGCLSQLNPLNWFRRRGN